MTKVEDKRMRKAMGVEELPKVSGAVSCPALCSVTQTCNFYEQRPLICRLWGVVQRLRCPFGCVPERWLSDKEADRLIRQSNTAGKGMSYGFTPKAFFESFGYGRGLSPKDFE
jgi:Fe-S-cluster containining protein